MSLNSGDRDEISVAFADELQTDELVAVRGECCFVDPGPDPAQAPDPPPDSDPGEEQDSSPDAPLGNSATLSELFTASFDI